MRLQKGKNQTINLDYKRINMFNLDKAQLTLRDNEIYKRFNKKGGEF